MAAVCSIVNNITVPAIGGIHSIASAGPFFFVQVANAAAPIVAMICTAPNGILRRIVLKGLNPNELTIRGPKVVIPPLGILLSVRRMVKGEKQQSDSRDREYQ